MGFRMSVCKEADREDINGWLGDDHKLYGYFSFEDVKDSFSYIGKFMRAQWEDILNNELYDDLTEVYGYICTVGATDDITLSEDEFKEFSDLYLKDVFKNKPLETYEYVYKYMHKLSETEGNKIIWWC